MRPIRTTKHRLKDFGLSEHRISEGHVRMSGGAMLFPDGQKDEEIEHGERGERDDVYEDEVHPRDVDADVDGVHAQRSGALDGFVLSKLNQELRAVHTGPHHFMRSVKVDGSGRHNLQYV